MIAAPEYNSSITPLLKNSLDWVSRKSTPEERGLSAFADKVAVLIERQSPGGFGGLRGLVHLRAMLGNIEVLVLPDQAGDRQGPRGVRAGRHAAGRQPADGDCESGQEADGLSCGRARVSWS